MVGFCRYCLCGYVSLVWQSRYSFFKEQNIPEVVDLNVLPEFRGQGIGAALLSTAEAKASERAQSVGLGVGLYADYGSAQRLYSKRGYIPDGKGITYNYTYVKPGSNVCVDDDLILWLVKNLK